MPRPANPETRSRLLEKGGDLEATRGFHPTGVQEITGGAGVPKGSFYNYFDSKEAFAVAVLTEYREAVVGEDGTILNRGRKPPCAQRALFRRACRVSRAAPLRGWLPDREHGA